MHIHNAYKTSVFTIQGHLGFKNDFVCCVILHACLICYNLGVSFKQLCCSVMDKNTFYAAFAFVILNNKQLKQAQHKQTNN